MNIPSKTAHDALSFYGWSYAGPGEYVHGDRPGERVIVQGRVGRGPIFWSHSFPAGFILSSLGCEALEYHLRSEEIRAVKGGSRSCAI